MIVLQLGDHYKMGIFKPTDDNKTKQFSEDETLWLGHPSELPKFLDGHPNEEGLVVRIRQASTFPWEAPGEIRDGKLFVYDMAEDYPYTQNPIRATND